MTAGKDGLRGILAPVLLLVLFCMSLTSCAGPDLPSPAASYVSSEETMSAAIPLTLVSDTQEDVPAETAPVPASAENQRESTVPPSESSTVPPADPPTLTLLGDKLCLLDYQDSFQDPGVMARDALGRDLKEQVIREKATDPGKHLILYTYRVRDEWGNENQISRLVRWTDLTPPELLLFGDTEMNLDSMDDYQEPGFSAWDSWDGHLTEKVKVDILPLSGGPGKVLIYSIRDARGNVSQAERIIHLKDTEAPLLILKGEAEMILDLDEEYTEPGYEAVDDLEGDLSSQVLREELPGEREGETFFRYSVSDSSGNSAQTLRRVLRKDKIPPAISLWGESSLSLEYGQAFQDPWVKATDNLEGDISGRVQVQGKVDIWTPGTYTLSYSVSDSYGNTASVSRQVTVKSRPQPALPAPPAHTGSRVVYLTFDDGPGPYTERLLNILAQYNAKATFFVTATFPQYHWLIGREIREGHTVALHTASHQYDQIYASEWAYFNDLAQIEQMVMSQTGQKPWLIRFPGGSSNTVSRKYNSGIMSRLAREVQNRGYRYTDWDVTSGDSGYQSPEKVFQNVINGISARSSAVVLMHDIKEHTVNAIESILAWCVSNGYSLLPITPSTPDVHHNIQN